MKKRICAMVLSTIMLFFACLVVLDVPTTVEAAEMTYSGTVSEKTTSDVLYLSTSGGTVQIKIDGSTEISNA